MKKKTNILGNLKNKMVKNNKESKKSKVKSKKSKPKDNKPKKVLWKTILNVLLIIAIIIISIGLVFALYIVISSPDFEKDKLYQKEPTILYDVNGDELARVGAENATVLTYDEIPDVLIDAVVATEDSRFFQHNGIDLFRFLKASILQLLGQDDAGGASTLDMQLMKNRYTGTDSNTGPKANKIQEIIRKFQDVYMSVFKLEAKFTKEEIMEFYLNTAWFSGGTINYTGTYGIEQASQYFFGKSSKDINLAEASLLAGMFQNPTRYNPYTNPEGCKNRQKIVLNLMVRHGYITDEQKDEVIEIPIESLLIEHGENNLEVKSSQAFVDYVLDEVSEDFGINARTSSLKIYTTFDPKVQAVLEKVEDGKVYEFRNEKENEGIAVTSTKDGSIVALSGGRNYQAQSNNWAVDLDKQPGSTAKPLVEYAMYIENISKSTYAMFLDEPTNYTNGGAFSNYDGDFDGMITMRWSVKDSRNVPAVLAFRELANLDKTIMLDFLDSVNIHPEDSGVLYEPDAIGGWQNGVSPLIMSAAYGAFARGGYYIEPYSYTKVIDTLDNNREHINNYTKTKIMEESTAYLMTNLLMSAYDGYTKPTSTTDVAGKTGTTNLDDKTLDKYGLKKGRVMDIWMMTYSPSYSIGLWVGYDRIYENAEENGWYLTSSLGSKARRTIMNYLSKNIHKKNEKFTVPKNVVNVNIEEGTFPPQLCSPYTPNNSNEKLCLSEWFVKGTEPTDVSNRYNTLADPTNGSYNYNGNTITISWNEIATPEAIDNNYLDRFFKTYYGDYSEKYYNERIKYNTDNIGTLGYRIYLVNSDGTETEIGYTNSNTYSYNVTSGGEYTFKVKSSYSIFKNNMSNGLIISTKTIDSNINDWVDDNNENNTDTGLN